MPILSLAALLLSGAAPASPATTIFTDARDARSYRTVTIGSLEWFAENLSFASADSRCYDDAPALCAHFGRLYRIQDPLKACPSGWRLPSERDWQSMEIVIGVASDDLEKTEARGENLDRKLLVGGATGFEGALPGWYDAHLGKYNALAKSAAFWTSTGAGPQLYWHRDLMPARGGIWRSPVDDSYWLSVRCVRERTN